MFKSNKEELFGRLTALVLNVNTISPPSYVYLETSGPQIQTLVPMTTHTWLVHIGPGCLLTTGLCDIIIICVVHVHAIVIMYYLRVDVFLHQNHHNYI